MRRGDVELSPAAFREAAMKGMLWLAHSTLQAARFTSDEAQCFLTISGNAADEVLAENAASIHRELLETYPLNVERLPDLPEPRFIIDYLSFCTQSERLGQPHPHKSDVLDAVHRHGEEFFWNVTPGELSRANCTTLINYYHFSRLQIPMTHSMQEVLAVCGPAALESARELSEEEFEQQLYFVTHWIYALSDYGAAPLARDVHPQLYQYLYDVLPEALAYGNLETLGEVVEGLKIFGHTNSDPWLRPALTNLLKRQNPDGSWGSQRHATTIHSTWCAVTALYEYRPHLDDARWGPPR